MRDTPHLRLLDRFRGHLHRSLTWRTEVPVAAGGDLRAWDGMVGATDWRFGVEAEARVWDWQAIERRVALKQRDGGVDGVLLVVWATRGNRQVLEELGDAVRMTFPIDGRRALELLAVGVHPGGNALIML